MVSLDKYLVNVSYVPPHVNGQQELNVNGVTFSIPTYSEEYWVASAPELKLSATGSSQIGAFQNLMIYGDPSQSSIYQYAPEPLSNVRTW
jgi:hypothetical protein